MLVFYNVSISIYNGYLLIGYATLFTSFPVFSLILDKDIPKSQVFKYPILYGVSQEGKYMSSKMFLIWFWKSIFQGSVIMLMALFLFQNTSFIKIVTITFTSLIIIEFLNIMTTIRTWNRVIYLSIVLSLFIYLICLIFLRKFLMLSKPGFIDLCKIIFLSFVSWFPIFLFYCIKKLFFPSQLDKIIMEEKL